MGTAKQYRSSLMASIHETAEGCTPPESWTSGLCANSMSFA